MIKNYCSIIGWTCIVIFVLCAFPLLKISAIVALACAVAGCVYGLLWFVIADILRNQEITVEAVSRLANAEQDTLDWIVPAMALRHIRANFPDVIADEIGSISVFRLRNGNFGLMGCAVKEGNEIGKAFEMEAACAGPLICASSWSIISFSWK